MRTKFISPGRVFAIDSRSLGIFRIALGFLLLLDTLQRLFMARTFYTDWGVFPRSYWIENYMVPFKFSLHLASGDAWFQYLLLGIQALAALAFLIGWRTRISNFVLLLLLCSLQSRNNQILSASDELMRLLLLWSLFLPTGEKFSVDSSTKAAREIVSVGSFALLFQGFSMYFFTALLKVHPVWTSEYSAVYYALHLDIFATPFAVWLRQFVGFTQFITVSTLVWEFVGPFLALLLCGWARFAAAVVFILFHLSLTLCLELGLFPYVAITYWLLYMPSELWEHPAGNRMEKALEKTLLRISAFFPASPKGENGSQRMKRAGSALAAVFLVLITWNNLASLKLESVQMPKFASHLVKILYLDQTWDMFAPYPIRNDGWFVIEAELQNGEQIDLWTQKPVTYEKPKLVSSTFPNSPWRKLMIHVWDEANPRILLPVSRYLCREYSAENGWPSGVATFRIQFVKETTPAIGLPFAPTEVRTLWSHDCFAR